MNKVGMLSPVKGGKMGEKDIRLKVYFDDAERYADLWNGSVFQGKQIVKAENLESISPALDVADEVGAEEMLRDVVMKQSLAGQNYALWTVENQEHIDYGMPVRIMRQEALAYTEQVRRKQKENAKGKLNKGGEYLYKLKKGDKIHPMSTLVVYWGKEEWDGPKSLHDMIDWGTESEEIQNLVPQYPIHFFDLSKVEHPEYFKTELRPFLELYKYRDDKEAFIDYLKYSEECSKMDNESWDVLAKVTNSPKLINKLKNKVEESKEEGKVCRALQEFYNDGIAEGKKTGISVFVEDYLEDGKEPEIIINKLIYRFELSEQEAQKYLQEAMQKGRTVS